MEYGWQDVPGAARTLPDPQQKSEQLENLRAASGGRPFKCSIFFGGAKKQKNEQCSIVFWYLFRKVQLCFWVGGKNAKKK